MRGNVIDVRHVPANIRETPMKHVFTRHDNRFMFPTVSAPGLGKRRFPKRSSENLFDWIPIQDELRQSRPLVSTYRIDFLKQEEVARDPISNLRIPQLLVPRIPQLSLPHCTASTTYRYSYKNVLPEERPQKFLAVKQVPVPRDVSSTSSSECSKSSLPELQKSWKDVDATDNIKSPKSSSSDLRKACDTLPETNSTNGCKSLKSPLTEVQRVLKTLCKDVSSTSSSCKYSKPPPIELPEVLTPLCENVSSSSSSSSTCRSSKPSLTELPKPSLTEFPKPSLTEFPKPWKVALEHVTVSDCLFWPESVL
uniref:Uncharacterized protein C3orf84 homolog isoform X2 n=1 Tax=Geotrypetes seraphini TaxID=260995 RepID=A0A6P8Q676_GEOSA|nr:uncharacterized protein C3orf84 homolog isoform X2 [Geotrypetes seraphini]